MLQRAPRVWFFSWVLACVGGAALFGYSLTQQTAIQVQMGHTMQAVNQSIVQTGGVVQQTATAMQPLLATTTALANIEEQQQRTVSDLKSMNLELTRLGNVEQTIITRLDSLNGTTKNITSGLNGLQSANQQVLLASETSSGQAATEASNVGDLNGMTQTSIAQLQRLNHKLAALKLVP